MDLENALDDGDCVDVVYLDSMKTFNMVPHKWILVKLKQLAGWHWGASGLVDSKLPDKQGTEW